MSPFLLSGHNIDPEITPIYAVRGGAHPFAFKAAATTVQAPGGAAVNMNVPPGIAVGDLLVAGHTAPGSLPAGWNSLNTSGIRSGWRIANGTATDNFLITAGGEKVAVYAVFSTPAGAAVNLQTPAIAQRFLATSFVEPAFLADVGFTDTLVACTTMRSGGTPTLVPVFANAGGLGYQLAAAIYQDWNLLAGTNTYDYVAITYIEESTPDARAETNLVYSPFEGGGTFISNGRSIRFRA